MPSDPLDWIDDELTALNSQGLLRRLSTRTGPQRPNSICLDGRQLINFGSNDYLGLAAEARLARASAEACERVGVGSGASPLISGRGSLHVTLQQELARFEGSEACLLFPTGFAANMGTVSALVGKGDAVFSDAKNHASIIDGCRLSGADVHVFAHRDCYHLQQLLRQATGYRRQLIVTDSLFSMDGDLAPLPELVQLAERYSTMLLVDEAHATGVFGTAGRGVSEHLGVEDHVHVRVGTLSKALGSLGGFVLGKQSLIDYLANRARSYFFSTAPPEAMAAAALAALEIIRNEPHRRGQLLSRAAALRQRLQSQGWQLGQSESQIVPVYLGDPQLTMRTAARLYERGLLVPGIRPPSVPAGQSLLRISLSYLHTDEMIDRLLAALGSIARPGEAISSPTSV